MSAKRTQGDEEIDRLARHVKRLHRQVEIANRPPQLSRLERWFVALEPFAYTFAMLLLGLLIVAAVWSLRKFGGWGPEG